MNISSWTANDWVCGSMVLVAVALLARFALAAVISFMDS